jgi:hypothetical protein
VREGKLLPSFPLEGRKTETSSPFKGEAGGGWGFEGAISPLWLSFSCRTGRQEGSGEIFTMSLFNYGLLNNKGGGKSWLKY